MARGELDRIEESTETINRGMADPINWLLCAGALVGIPFTGGLSVGLAVIALLRATKGGKANVQAMQPTMADVASPGDIVIDGISFGGAVDLAHRDVACRTQPDPAHGSGAGELRHQGVEFGTGGRERHPQMLASGPCCPTCRRSIATFRCMTCCAPSRVPGARCRPAGALHRVRQDGRP